MPSPTIREQLYSFAALPKDWDSYDSEAIQQEIIDDAIKIVDAVENLGGEINWAIPTTCETVLMQFVIGDNRYQIEIDIDHFMGVAVWRSKRLPGFYDYMVQQFIKKLPNL